MPDAIDDARQQRFSASDRGELCAARPCISRRTAINGSCGLWHGGLSMIGILIAMLLPRPRIGEQTGAWVPNASGGHQRARRRSSRRTRGRGGQAGSPGRLRQRVSSTNLTRIAAHGPRGDWKNRSREPTIFDPALIGATRPVVTVGEICRVTRSRRAPHGLVVRRTAEDRESH